MLILERTCDGSKMGKMQRHGDALTMDILMSPVFFPRAPTKKVKNVGQACMPPWRRPWIFKPRASERSLVKNGGNKNQAPIDKENWHLVAFLFIRILRSSAKRSKKDKRPQLVAFFFFFFFRILWSWHRLTSGRPCPVDQKFWGSRLGIRTSGQRDRTGKNGWAKGDMFGSSRSPLAEEFHQRIVCNLNEYKHTLHIITLTDFWCFLESHVIFGSVMDVSPPFVSNSLHKEPQKLVKHGCFWVFLVFECFWLIWVCPLPYISTGGFHFGTSWTWLNIFIYGTDVEDLKQTATKQVRACLFDFKSHHFLTHRSSVSRKYQCFFFFFFFNFQVCCPQNWKNMSPYKVMNELRNVKVLQTLARLSFILGHVDLMPAALWTQHDGMQLAQNQQKECTKKLLTTEGSKWPLTQIDSWLKHGLTRSLEHFSINLDKSDIFSSMPNTFVLDVSHYLWSQQTAMSNMSNRSAERLAEEAWNSKSITPEMCLQVRVQAFSKTLVSNISNF